MATILGFEPAELAIILGLFYVFVVVPIAGIAAVVYAVRTTSKNDRKR